MFGSYVADLEKGIQSDPAVSNLLLKSGFTPGAKKLAEIYVQPRFTREVSEYSVPIQSQDLKFGFGDRLIDQKILMTQVVQLSMLSQLVGSFYAPSVEGTTLGQSILEVARFIYQEWDRAFTEHRRRRDIPPEEKGRNTAAFKVPKLDDVIFSNQQLIDRALEVFTSLEITLALSNQYVTKVRNKSKTILQEETRAHSLIDSLHRRQPTLIIRKGAKIDSSYKHDVLDTSGADYLMTAPAGFGKTSYCRSQTLRDLKRLRDGISNKVPIYIPLHKLSSNSIEDFEQGILCSEELIDLWRSRRSGPTNNPVRFFRLYLDGIDEIPDEIRQKEILEVVQKAKSEEPELQIVVTGREHVSGVHLTGLFRLRVNEMEDDQISELVEKWFNADAGEIAAFNKQIQELSQLKPVLRVPLLATLVLGVYTSTGTLPQSRVAIYDMFVALLAGGWDIAKKVQRDTQFGPEPKVTVLIKLAGILHLGNKRDANASDFKSALGNTLPGMNDKWNRMLQELVHDGFLIRAGDNYAFCHLSFQEFLAAKDLFDSKGRKARTALLKYLKGDAWWRDVLTFYIALLKNPKEMEDFIRETAAEALSTSNDETIVGRASFLLEDLMLSYPGAKPNFNIPRKAVRQGRLNLFQVPPPRSRK